MSELNKEKLQTRTIDLSENDIILLIGSVVSRVEYLEKFVNELKEDDELHNSSHFADDISKFSKQISSLNSVYNRLLHL